MDNHTFTTGYIYNSGETGFPYLGGAEANTYIDAWATDFLSPNEKPDHCIMILKINYRILNL